LSAVSRLSTRRHFTRRSGAIAQLGERVVRNDEVGGSIPPGSTIAPSGFAWRSREMPEGQYLKNKVWCPA
jgi:hypothetical protein